MTDGCLIHTYEERHRWLLSFSTGNDSTPLHFRHTLQTIQQYYRVDRRKIAFIKFIFEAYDGIATMKTIDARKGVILFYIAPGCEQQFQKILQDLAKQILIRPLNTGSAN